MSSRSAAWRARHAASAPGSPGLEWRSWPHSAVARALDADDGLLGARDALLEAQVAEQVRVDERGLDRRHVRLRERARRGGERGHDEHVEHGVAEVLEALVRGAVEVGVVGRVGEGFEHDGAVVEGPADDALGVGYGGRVGDGGVAVGKARG
jgi:hypothetical protein